MAEQGEAGRGQAEPRHRHTRHGGNNEIGN